MVISRSPGTSHAVSRQLHFGCKNLSLQDCIKILGMSVDPSLRFDHHIATLACQTSLRVSTLRRVANTLDALCILTHYRAQIRPCIEYSALSWMSKAGTNL